MTSISSSWASPSVYRTAGRKGARKGVLRSTDVVVTDFVPTATFGFEATEHAGS